MNDSVIDLVRKSAVVLSLDWIDLGGLLNQAWKSERIAAKVIHASVDVQLHHGFSMEHLSLPRVDVNLLAEPDIVTVALLAAVRSKPSGADLATKSAPRIELLPGRFSTITGWPSDSLNRCATNRLDMSTAPPAE